MKNAIASIRSKIFLLFLCLIANVYAFAQDAGTTTQTNSTETHSSSSTAPVANNAPGWFNNPIVWVAGGLVFILILVAILSARSSASKVSKTTKTEIKAE